jgi:hypothetical protein
MHAALVSVSVLNLNRYNFLSFLLRFTPVPLLPCPSSSSSCLTVLQTPSHLPFLPPPSPLPRALSRNSCTFRCQARPLPHVAPCLLRLVQLRIRRRQAIDGHERPLRGRPCPARCRRQLGRHRTSRRPSLRLRLRLRISEPRHDSSWPPARLAAIKCWRADPAGPARPAVTGHLALLDAVHSTRLH